MLKGLSVRTMPILRTGLKSHRIALRIGPPSVNLKLALRLRIADQLPNRQRDELAYGALRLRGNLSYLLVLLFADAGAYPYGLHMKLCYMLRCGCATAD
jgi:hypothetical protein